MKGLIDSLKQLSQSDELTSSGPQEITESLSHSLPHLMHFTRSLFMVYTPHGFGVNPRVRSRYQKLVKLHDPVNSPDHKKPGKTKHSQNHQSVSYAHGVALASCIVFSLCLSNRLLFESPFKGKQRVVIRTNKQNSCQIVDVKTINRFCLL